MDDYKPATIAAELPAGPPDPLPGNDDLPLIPQPAKSVEESLKEQLTSQWASKYARNHEDAKRIAAKILDVTPEVRHD